MRSYILSNHSSAVGTALLFANTDWYLFNFRRPLAHALLAQGYRVLLVSPPGPYVKQLVEAGFDWREAPMQRRSLNPFRELKLIIWLWRLMRREGVNIFHGFTLKSVILGSLAARAAVGIKRINSIDGLGYVYTSSDFRAKCLRPFVSALLRMALSGNNSQVVLLNRDDVAFFSQTGWVKPSQIQLIPGTGTDCQRFVPKAAANHAQQKDEKPVCKVLLSCRLLWDKGVGEYVAAAEQLRSNGVEVEFLLAGAPDPGNPASVSTEYLAAWGKAGFVTLLGHVSDMPALYAKVDIVALPSYREGLPTGLVEAAAAGLPVIATDVPGCRDVVTHMQTGLLIPPKDATALAAAVQTLCDSPELRQRLGAAARARALERFDTKKIVAKTLALYEA